MFRTSFSNWQPTHPLGKVMVGNGHKKAVFITWKYAAGEEALASFDAAGELRWNQAFGGDKDQIVSSLTRTSRAVSCGIASTG